MGKTNPILVAALFSVLSGSLNGLLAAEAPQSNILLLYVDNLGYGDLGCYGHPQAKTPAIDRLATQGVRCTDFYVVAPTCTVSRGAILTGRYPERNGLLHQLRTTENWTGVGLPHTERIIPQYLQAAGYATGCFGKWNIGFAPGSRPTERGFDEFLGCRSGNINYYKHTYHGDYDIFRGTERERVEGYSTDLFAEAACDFIRRNAERRWFVYLPFNAVHYVGAPNVAPGEKAEWQAPPEAFAAYGWSPDEPDEKRRYLAVVTALDNGVQRVLETLDSEKLADDTLVMFISDMGAVWRRGTGREVASNGPYRDGSPSLYEGGVRVPAIFRWPGRIAPDTESHALLSHLDVLPLCLLAAGLEPTTDRVLDGRNPVSALIGEKPSPHERMVYSLRGASAVREGTLKIVRSKPADPWELYDLAADPGEARNLARERPADVARLAGAFAAWEVDVKRDASTPVPESAPPRAPAVPRGN